MSNYPSGVTGFEYQISGADVETTRFLSCEGCEWEGDAYAEIAGKVVTVWCPDCGRETDWMIWEEHDD